MSTAGDAATVWQLWPLLYVQDIERSIKFYRDQLGFELVEQADAQGQVFWCRLQRGGACLMLQQAEAEDGPAESRGRGRGVALYFICDDANQMYVEFSSRGLALEPPQIAYYGMNQLYVPEPDGYVICFESSISRNSDQGN